MVSLLGVFPTGVSRPPAPNHRERDVHNRDGVVIEDCGYIFRGEFVGCVANEETCLANGTVTDDDASAQASVRNCLGFGNAM